MKKFLLSLMLVAFAASINAQTVAPVKQEIKKECCKDHKDGKKCDKPADKQCPDCKAKAAAAQNHECKEGKKCDKAVAQKQDCCKDKKMEGKKCDKAQAMKKCEKADGMKKCEKTAAQMKDCCKDKKMEGKKCDKPADKQCPDCKEKAKKN